MDVRGRGRRVPEQLGVVVRVGVDHAGHDDEARGVELFGGVVLDGADRDDASVVDTDVGDPTRPAGAVDQRAGPDDVAEHESGILPGGPAAIARWLGERCGAADQI